MRRARFRDPGGVVRTGQWTDRGITFGGQTYDPADVDVLPPCTPSKLVGASTNNVDLIEQEDLEVPDRPKLFLKAPSTVVGHRDAVTLLPGKDLEWEAELAAVVGEQCRHVDAGDAMDVVEGFTCANDITNWTDRDTYGFRFKSVDNTAPLGPVVVPPDRVPDDARIELRVNGETEQSTSRSKFVFDVREVISEVTTYTTLERGDVVMMGTGPGVGMLEPGDEVEVEIEGIGTLAHSVREPDASG